MQKPKKAEHNDIPDLVSTCHIQCTAKIPVSGYKMSN